MNEQIEAAANRLLQGGCDEWDAADYAQSFQRDEDIEAVANWTLARIAADKAEREERAKPIDADWCLANGAAWNMTRAVAWWRLLDNSRIEFNATNGVALIVGNGWSYLDHIATRGQLLDLLRAMKGGDA